MDNPEITVSTASNFLSTFGSNVGTMVVFAVGYFLWKKCDSKCHYDSKDGWEIDLGAGEEDDDSEDEHMKQIFQLFR